MNTITAVLAAQESNKAMERDRSFLPGPNLTEERIRTTDFPTYRIMLDCLKEAKGPTPNFLKKVEAILSGEVDLRENVSVLIDFVTVFLEESHGETQVDRERRVLFSALLHRLETFQK